MDPFLLDGLNQNTRKIKWVLSERLRGHRQEVWLSYPVFLMGCVVWSHHLAHEISHGFRRLALHLPGGVGVGAEREPCVVVPQHTGHRLDVHAVLQGQGGECVLFIGNRLKPVVKADFSSYYQNVLEGIKLIIRRCDKKLQHSTRKCMPLWHNKDKSENPCVASEYPQRDTM